MESADGIRQFDAAVPARTDHARELEDEFDQRPRRRPAYAPRAWSTRSHRGGAAGWQNDFAEGNREGDPGESSRNSVDYSPRGRAAGRSDRSSTGSRLRRLQFDLRRELQTARRSGGAGARTRETPRRTKQGRGGFARQHHAAGARL